MSEQETSNALVIPGQGTVVNLENEREISIAYRDLRAVRDELTRIDRILREALQQRSTVLGSKTFHLEGVGKVTLGGSVEVEYDPQIIEDGLRALECPENIIREIVVEVVSYKVDGVRAKQAATANPEYAAVIESGKTLKQKLPSVSFG